MAISEVTICNIALFRIGHGQKIDSLSESSAAAEYCRVLYPVCRDRLLEAFPWNFARKRIVLADIGTPPTNWDFQYQYPPDCLKVREIIVSGTRCPTSANRISYEICQNTVNEGLSICTDAEDAEIIYTAQVTNTRLFTQGFADALSWSLAGELVSPLSRDPKYITIINNSFTLALRNAQALDMSENREDYPTSEFIDARA